MIFKNRFWFYLIIIALHIIWFIRTNIIPSRVDALILITIYLIMFTDGIKFTKDNKEEKK